LADDKRKPMAMQNDFLGIRHDLEEALSKGVVRFWVREALQAKCAAAMAECKVADSLTPGQASKLVGSLGFAMQAAYNRVGQAALAPLWQRMHSDKPPWSLSDNINRSFEFLDIILAQRPRRTVQLMHEHELPIIVASDAQADTAPSGGYLLHDVRSGERTGAWFNMTAEHLQVWVFTQQGLADGQNPIQCCEAAMLPWAILKLGARVLRGRRVLWFIDNTSALYAAVKGSSKHPAVARAIAFANFAAFHWSFHIWFEFVDSEGN
jgi:hypothetical protein